MTLASARVVPIAIVTAALLLPIALGFAVVRAVRRNQRGDERQRTRRLAARMRGYLRGRVPALALADAVGASTESEFWHALESRLPRLTRAERRRLGGLLEKSRPVAAERRSLVHESPLRRELAARRLALTPSLRSRRALRGALGTSPELVGYAAARALARDGDMRALEWLLARPDAFPHRSARAWSGLVRAFGRRALPRIAAAVASDAVAPRVMRAAIETLGHARHAAAAPAIERRLGDPDVDVRVAAARALGRIESGPCSDALLVALGDPAWPVRAQAAWALGRIGLDGAVPALAACLTDPQWWVRRHAAYALAGLGARGTAALREAVAASPDRYARDIADEALQRMPRPA
jgi:hypothetical protein